MSPLEQLGPFVSLCQACGFMPYTIEYDSTNKKFLRFRFSFRHLITWWFIILLVLQLVCPHVMNKKPITSYVTDIVEDQKAPITVSILAGVTIFCYVSQFLLCRWMILFNYRRLQSAVKIAKKIEKCCIRHDHVIALKSSTFKRFIIGFNLIIISVSY